MERKKKARKKHKERGERDKRERRGELFCEPFYATGAVRPAVRRNEKKRQRKKGQARAET